MKCPYCGKDNTRVIDSRPAEDKSSIRRRRSCDECGRRFTTYEKVETIPLIENVFHLTYCENRGAAFGILQNRFGLFFCITAVVLVAVTVYMIKKRPQNLCLNLSVTLLVGGALGNFIDRIFRGFVVDFFDFRLIHFAIFNVADCFVVCGAVLLAWYLIFVEGDAESAHKNAKPDGD